MNKKEQNEKKGEQKMMVITTRTLVNGYELIVNEEGYMYFNVKSLLEGFMVHRSECAEGRAQGTETSAEGDEKGDREPEKGTRKIRRRKNNGWNENNEHQK